MVGSGWEWMGWSGWEHPWFSITHIKTKTMYMKLKLRTYTSIC